MKKKFFPDELSDFDAAFFTGTAAEVTPISAITMEDNQTVSFDISKTDEIKNNFFAMTEGEGEFAKKWFSHI